MTIRTRFAPSPTGFLHIGGARTALFGYLYTRRLGGTFILRVEDTDRERSTQAATDAILEGMRWLGLDADEGPFFQSDSTARHLELAGQLLDRRLAYRCTCSRERLDALRTRQRELNIKPRYDGHCRDLDRPAEGEPFVIRFKTPLDGETAWADRIQGNITIANNELDDLILVRSDGSPTYNLAVVADDHAMGITLVIRGEDHTSNTPRQIHLFQAMGWPVPDYAHMPLLHGTDGAKLSKRHGAVSVLQYRDDGFLPVAVNNYLVRLGWSHGEQEIFSMAEMERLFDIDRVGRSAAIFDTEKLLWINGHHIRNAAPEALAPELGHHLERLGVAAPDPARLTAIIPEFQPRAKTLVEMAEKCRFFFVASVEPYDAKAQAKHCDAAILPALAALVTALDALTEWQPGPLEAAFQGVLAAQDLKMGRLAQPVRVALTGGVVSPGIFETLHLMGRETALERLRRGLAVFQAAAGTPPSSA